ncbi:MAG: DUF262 domain-containing protein [Actinomycetales bacterium]
MSQIGSVKPGAITLSLRDLVEDAWEGRIRVPHLQRPFRWGRADVVRLCDSILRGYPIGSLLLWRRPAAAERITLGALTIDAPELADALWVVDGQQRITSLANVLHPDASVDIFAVGLDLETGQVKAMPSRPHDTMIPLHVLFGLSTTLTWFAERPHLSDQQSIAFDVAQRLRDVKIPGFQVTDEKIETLQDIFDRMNNAGKRLRRAEIFDALARPPKTLAEGLGIAAIGERVGSKHFFGPIDDGTVLQAVLARRGPDVTRDIHSEFAAQAGRPEEGEAEALRAGEAALDAAVAFTVNSGVPHLSMVPYRFALVVLARFFALYPTPDAAHRRLLSRWLWRAFLAGPGLSKGGSPGATRTMCAAITPDGASASLLRLLGPLEHRSSLPSLELFRPDAAESKLVLCALWAQSPRDPTTGLPFERSDLASCVESTDSAREAIHELLPRGAVESTGDDLTRDAANSIIAPSDG